MNIRDILGKKLIFLDGGMGTQLQNKGLKAGELPETFNITNPQLVREIHEEYLASGADIVLSNTFGANILKFNAPPFTLEEIVSSGVKLAKQACEKYSTAEKPRFVALDLGPTGKLLKPMGDLDFEDCVNIYKEVITIGEKAGADLILIETMSDTLEIKAAVLAAKECSDLPIFATMMFDQKGKLLTGGNPLSAVALLEGMGVDALGINCGLGPIQMLPILKEFLEYASIPVIISPNAGLPVFREGETVYDISSNKFAEVMKQAVEMGGCILGGCCGTTPEHISKLTDICKNMKPQPIIKKDITVVSSYSHGEIIGDKPVIIGERINPTGKKRFKQALIEKDFDYILGEGINQQQAGANILDVNVGLPEIDEVEMLKSVVCQLQSITSLPLQLDTASPKALENALRGYNGKALINSVNGKAESMEEVFPLVKKYGGVVVGLTLDESGIPETAMGRYKVAEKIVNTARSYGIDKKDIVIDVLTMTISAQPDSAKITLDALKLVREKLGVNTVLGVSNISFGLPRREIINSNFFTLALNNGLTSAIINPNSEAMMSAYFSYCALIGYDQNCMNYINKYSDTKIDTALVAESSVDLCQAVEKGLKDRSITCAKILIDKGVDPLIIIEDKLIPALDIVGKAFESGKLFLPQLLMSAEAAKAAFEVIKDAMSKAGKIREKGEKIILATVKGDIHDIGKNIVKVLLENYGFDVIDLGKDVEPKLIVDTAINQNVKLVGLSALMTTTVVAMKETIDMLNKLLPNCKIIVGGAVLTEDYAKSINADSYGSDAMSTVSYAQNLLKGN